MPIEVEKGKQEVKAEIIYESEYDEETGNIKAGFRHAGRKRSVFSSLPVMWIDLNFSCYFSAFSIASCAAFLIPVELNVAPLIVSTSTDCASIIFGMIASAATMCR